VLQWQDMQTNPSRVLPVSLALLLAGSLAGCAEDSEVIGNASMMTTELGEHDGYTLVACPDQDRWLVIGDGTHYFNDVSPGAEGRSAAVIRFGNEVLAPAVTDLESLVAWGGVNVACQPDSALVSSASVHNWGEIDSLIHRVGDTLSQESLSEVVQVAVEPPIQSF